MGSENEEAELKKQNEALKQELQKYKSLEEDLMANRIFEKAKKLLFVYITFGGIIVLLGALIGIKALEDYAMNLAKEKINTIAGEEIKKALQAEGERQIANFVKDKQADFILLAQQQIEHFYVATQPIGQSQGPRESVATKGAVDYTGQMSPVRQTGSEGAVVGFAAAAALEYQIKKASGRLVIISPRQIYYYARLKEGSADRDSGARIKDGIDVLLEKGGIAEAAWPYIPGEFAAKPPKDIEQVEHFKISMAQPVRNVKELKAALQAVGPVVGGLTLYEPAIGDQVRKTGRIPLPGAKDGILGATAVCFVGFDDDSRILKFKNEWGTDWGDQGYGYISYEYAEKFLGDAWAISIK